jgi:hypothetical protein
MGQDLAVPFKRSSARKRSGLFTRIIHAMRKSSDKTVRTCLWKEGALDQLVLIHKSLMD